MKIDTYQALLILLIIISFNRWTKDAKFSLLKVGLYIKKWKNWQISVILNGSSCFYQTLFNAYKFAFVHRLWKDAKFSLLKISLYIKNWEKLADLSYFKWE